MGGQQSCPDAKKHSSDSPNKKSDGLPTQANVSKLRNNFILYISLCVAGLVMLLAGIFIKNTMLKTGLIIVGVILFLMTVFPAYQYWVSYQAVSALIGTLYKYPDPDYMLAVGAQCPDGWVPERDPHDPKNIRCVNRSNVPVNPSFLGECYDDPTSGARTKTFKKITEWPPEPSDLKTRCNFIQKCGPNASEPAVWTGINCSLTPDEDQMS